jgi:hypothetical protein
MGITRKPALAAILAAGLFISSGGVALASASGPDRACGQVTFDYSFVRVVAGELMDMDLSIVNCSTHTERLRLHVRTSGPCAFPHPVAHTYKLIPHFAVASTALIISPSCEGHYSVRVKLTLRGTRAVLDTARDGFSVRRS